jgi:gamma-glutamylcyclotransferase
MKYFAYGSNMDKDRMTKRGISFTSREFAKVSGFKLVFNKKASAGNFSYANIIPAENNFVEGVLYDFPDNEISKLDKAEGYPDHYNRIHITVSDKNNHSIVATTYIAQHNKIASGLLPTKEYLNFILAGEDILSPAYLESLKQIQTNESE